MKGRPEDSGKCAVQMLGQETKEPETNDGPDWSNKDAVVVALDVNQVTLREPITAESERKLKK